MRQNANIEPPSRAWVSRNPEIHSGDLVFAGTRVPVENLVDYLKGGDTVNQFLEDFPTVGRWQVERLLDQYPQLVGISSTG